MAETSNLDIWRSANLLIQQHGDQATWIAAQRADALLAQGDMVGGCRLAEDRQRD